MEETTRTVTIPIAAPATTTVYTAAPATQLYSTSATPIYSTQQRVLSAAVPVVSSTTTPLYSTQQLVGAFSPGRSVGPITYLR